jgi:hypothetical protein
MSADFFDAAAGDRDLPRGSPGITAGHRKVAVAIASRLSLALSKAIALSIACQARRASVAGRIVEPRSRAVAG